MAENTKNILEVDVVQNIDKTDTVLVNDNNSLKQVGIETLVSSGIPDQYIDEDKLENKLNEKQYATKNDVNDELEKKVTIFPNAGSHNSIYRGENLGSEVTEAQWNAIQTGTFDDLYIGDYWTINGAKWRIAAFDYFYNCGDVAFTKHHVVIVPDTNLYMHNMNDTNITTGAYVGSKMYTEGLEQAKTMIQNAFGTEHVLSHRIYLSNAVSNGKTSAGAWTDSIVDLMCEQMVYGCGIFSPVSDGSVVPNNYRVEKCQLPLFTLNPQLISNRAWYWLRDVISSATFANVGGSGAANYNNASSALGVRPFSCIGI